MAIVWEARGEARRVLGERRTFRARLASIAKPPSDIDAAELIYGELVANTIRHANGSVEVRVETVDAHPPVLVVRDHGPGMRPGRRPAAPDGELLAESGRGLAIVETLAERVEVAIPEDGGTIVRAVLPVTLNAE